MTPVLDSFEKVSDYVKELYDRHMIVPKMEIKIELPEKDFLKLQISNREKFLSYPDFESIKKMKVLEIYSSIFDIKLIFEKEGTKIKKPPIGIKPKKFHDEDRLEQLNRVIENYLKNGREISSEWVIERNNLIESLKK